MKIFQIIIFVILIILFNSLQAQCIFNDPAGHPELTSSITQYRNMLTWEEFIRQQPRSTMQKKSYQFIISGKIIYHDSAANKELNAYGVPVQLALKVKNSDKVVVPNFFWDTGYAITDTEGQFSISCNVFQDLSGFDKLVVAAMHEGHLVELDVSWYDYIISNGYPAIRFDEGEGVQIPFSSNQSNYNFEDFVVAVKPIYGITFSSIAYGHRFVNRIYNYNIPFPLPKIRITDSCIGMNDNDGGMYGNLQNKLCINYPNFPNLNEELMYTILHEFGHHVQFRMNTNLNVATYKAHIDESFAEFFSIACGNYMQTLQPMYMGQHPVWEYLELHKGNMVAITYPEYTEYINFFLNLFDGYDSNGFIPERYNGDNECINGGSPDDPESIAHQMFDAFRTVRSFEQLINKLKLSQNNAIHPHLDFLWQYHKNLNDSDLNDPELIFPTPPQIKSARAFKASNTSIYLKIEQQDYYSVCAQEDFNAMIEYSAMKQLKLHKSINAPKGIRLYKNQQLVKDLDYYNVQFIEGVSTEGAYKVGAYNETGESLDKKTIQIEEFSIKMVGPSVINADENGQWFAQVTNGMGGPYDYTWYLKQKDGYFEKVGQNNLNFTTESPITKDFTLKVKVSYQGILEAVVEKKISVNVRPISIKLEGDEFSFVNQTKTFTAQVEGGVTPYKLIWGKKYKGDVLYQDIYEGNMYKTKSTENYIVRVSVEDALGQIVNSQEHLVTIFPGPLHAEVDGPTLVSMDKEQTWFAEAYGGVIPYKNILWLKREKGEPLFKMVHTGESYTELPTKNFELKIAVWDGIDQLMESEVIHVDVVYNFMMVTIEGPETLFKGNLHTFTADVIGGQPPYKYYWNYLYDKFVDGGLYVTENNELEVLIEDYETFRVFVRVVDNKGEWIITYQDFPIIGDVLYQEPSELPFDEVEIYPNPAQDMVYVHLANKQEFHVTLYSYEGDQIATEQSEFKLESEKVYTIDLRSLPRKIYYLQINYMDQGKWRTVQRKLVLE